MTLGPRCTTSKIALAFWGERVSAQPGFNPDRESFSALVLAGERRLLSAHAVDSKAFGNGAKFADELFQSDFLRGVPVFILVHNRPGVVLEASADDIERVRQVILAGRSRKTELLDCLVIGKPDAAHPSGVFSFYKIKGFSAEIPFSKTAKKPRQSSAKGD